MIAIAPPGLPEHRSGAVLLGHYPGSCLPHLSKIRPKTISVKPLHIVPRSVMIRQHAGISNKAAHAINQALPSNLHAWHSPSVHGSPQTLHGTSDAGGYESPSALIIRSNPRTIPCLVPGCTSSNSRKKTRTPSRYASSMYGHAFGQTGSPTAPAYAVISLSGTCRSGLMRGTSPGCTLACESLASRPISPRRWLIRIVCASSSRLCPIAR